MALGGFFLDFEDVWAASGSGSESTGEILRTAPESGLRPSDAATARQSTRRVCNGGPSAWEQAHGSRAATAKGTRRRRCVAWRSDGARQSKPSTLTPSTRRVRRRTTPELQPTASCRGDRCLGSPTSLATRNAVEFPLPRLLSLAAPHPRRGPGHDGAIKPRSGPRPPRTVLRASPQAGNPRHPSPQGSPPRAAPRRGPGRGARGPLRIKKIAERRTIRAAAAHGARGAEDHGDGREQPQERGARRLDRRTFRWSGGPSSEGVGSVWPTS